MSTTEVSTVNPEEPKLTETRCLTDSFGNRRNFEFLTVDSAEKWEEASKIACHYNMPIVGANKSLRFQVRSLSLGEWEKVEAENPIPQWLQDDLKEDEAHKKSRELAENKKQIEIIENSIGKKVPGETLEQKISFLMARNPGELEALYLFIQNDACGFADGQLLGQYNSLCSLRQMEYEEFDSFDSWKCATESSYFFRIHRPSQDYIVEFPLRAIAKDRKAEIDNETKIPDAPQVPKVDPNTRRVIVGQMIPNTQDPSWVKVARAISQKRMVMYLSEVLRFPMPGDTTQDKYHWLGKRSVGDVVRLQQFVDSELLGYRSRYDFLSRNYGLQNL